MPGEALGDWTAAENDSTQTVDPSQIDEIVTRLETLESRQSAAYREVEQALETLAMRIGRSAATKGGDLERGALERLARLESESQRRIERLSHEMGMLANRYSDIEERYEHGRQEIAETLERLARRPGGAPSDSIALGKIETALGAIEKRVEAVGRDGRAAATTFEHALKAVMERVLSGEKRQQEQARGFERALEDLGQRLQEAVAREGSSETEAIRALEHSVSEITQHFETIEKRRERASRAVEDAIKSLTERLTESDRRYSQQVQAPLTALDQAVERMTQRVEQAEGKTQNGITALDKQLQESNARTQMALQNIGERLGESEQRTQASVVALGKRLKATEDQGQESLAQLDQKLRASEQQSQQTLATIDSRLMDIAERIDHIDTDAKASRLSLMKVLDDTRRRVSVIEDRPASAPAPQTPEEAPPPAPETPRFDPILTEEETESEAALSPAEHEDLAPMLESEHDVIYDLDDEVEVEIEPASIHEAQVQEETPPEEPPPYQTPEPVWALLAAARSAARAEAAKRDLGDERIAFDLAPQDYARRTFGDELEAESTDSDQTTAQVFGGSTLGGVIDSERKRKKTGAWRRRAALISLVVLGVVGFSAWEILNPPAPNETGRPSLIRSLLDTIGETFGKTPQGAAQAPVHVSQGTSAPDLPAPIAVAPHPVKAEGSAAREAASNNTSPKPVPKPLDTAKIETPASKATAPAAPETASLVHEAIAAARSAQTDEERARAAALLLKAAETGDAESQFMLGRVYETGRGVKANLPAAARWYAAAADQGHVAAAFNLGMIEAQSGTREGYGHAARWFNQAARHGLVDAQFNLGMLYAQGLGINRDPIEAYAWFSAAAAQGDAGAAAERDRIGKALDQAARARGEALARERSTPPKADTNRG